ncbi:MAG TPA: lipopolysaccharide heptosyltransferase II [Pirellulales bacterium]|nr:lipopolysaccharide heptosyltransferase II [Pirellulales bacterium]
MKIGVFIPKWVGDAAMCVPTLRALRRHYGPQAEIIGIVSPYVTEVLAGTPWLDDVILFDRKSADRSRGTRGVWHAMRKRKLDVAVDLTNSFRSAGMAWLSRTPLRIGYARNFRSPFLTHKLVHPRVGYQWLATPAIDSYLQLAYALGCECESPRLELATSAADEAAADAVWAKLKLPPGERVVIVNSGGAAGPAKSWPTEHFASLARRLAVEDGLAVLAICGPAERDRAQDIAAQADHPSVVSLAGEDVSIGLSKACVRRSRLMVTTDSGPRFFAIAFQVPVVTLFGPTDPAWTRTRDPLETCLSHPVACAPCGQRTCLLGHHNCMRQLSVERVHAAAKMRLATQPSKLAA